jgi:uncharacterized protein (DUF2267 family)
MAYGDVLLVVFDSVRDRLHHGDAESHWRKLHQWVGASLAHDPEKWEPVFGKDHAQC